MNEHDKFQQEVLENITSLSNDADLQALSRIWIREIAPHKWSYNFSWLGRPAIQFPNDAWALQEIVWKVKPDLIIETGIAHGGSLMISASLLALLDYTDAVESGQVLDPKSSRRKVIGIDIDIREHNRDAIERHPLAHKIQMFQGSSIDPETIKKVKEAAKGYQRVLVCLDSNHTYEHVLSELNAYAPLVSSGSYCIVYDTIIEDMPAQLFDNRPWCPGNSPKTAVYEFIQQHPEFVIDKQIDAKLQISVAPDGFLKRR
ncbi:cephalosporin hydroxylase [Alishewanella longhuensis]|uniref:Cephalosporin hydroxylase n=1 Tax=Alishewanella longhuensis TaxID=1091037 RepID=A0ABQ3L0T9_9ALTE|nr:cephalosporin hydroxylase family protein [Alishewanella longhuensis]GHG69323.1 cephalosporin hydroxylase [Alishewanella longhuensis]